MIFIMKHWHSQAFDGRDDPTLLALREPKIGHEHQSANASELDLLNNPIDRHWVG